MQKIENNSNVVSTMATCGYWIIICDILQLFDMIAMNWIFQFLLTVSVSARCLQLKEREK